MSLKLILNRWASFFLGIAMGMMMVLPTVSNVLVVSAGVMIMMIFIVASLLVELKITNIQ